MRAGLLPLETDMPNMRGSQLQNDVKDSGKKWVYALFYVTALMLLSFYWHSMKSNTWPSKVVFDCNQQPPINNVTNTSRLDLLEEVSLQRMLYDRPDTMKPPRSDVLIMTPWFSPIVWNGTYNIDILNAQFHQKDVRIGLTLFAIKKYTVFVQTFIETAENFFMVGQKVNYYVFTDRVSDIPNITLSQGRNMVILKVHSYKRWQEVCMRRMEMIRDHLRQRIINEVDYLVCADIDMKFSDDVGLEILSDVFGTLHPGFHRATRAEFTYERRQESTAYIPTDEGDFYYAAGYFGGTVEEVYKLTNFCHNAMMTDKENHIEAIWHDESYLNKYFLYHKPTKILSPEYLWDNGFGVPEHIKRRRFVAVPKNHNAIRNKRDLQDYSRVKLKFHSCQSF